MFCYLIKIGVKEYKSDELLDSLGTFSKKFQNEDGCLGYHIYQGYDESDSYMVVGEWQNYLAMQRHFRSDDFKILVGALKVLGDSSELMTVETVPLN